MKQVKLISTGTNNPTICEHMLSHPERGDVPKRNVETKEDYYLGTP